jgi:hypothetical protein
MKAAYPPPPKRRFQLSGYASLAYHDFSVVASTFAGFLHPGSLRLFPQFQSEMRTYQGVSRIASTKMNEYDQSPLTLKLKQRKGSLRAPHRLFAFLNPGHGVLQVGQGGDDPRGESPTRAHPPKAIVDKMN